ncbi:MAG: HDOD domain-containing protein [Rhodocyclaceae bacterium]|nr:HDOD domain-containing protein [Rhodocyclaceae bacterium]
MISDLEFEVPQAPRSALPEGAGGWVQRIAQQDMPAFGVTVDGVRCVTDDESASAARLSQVILQDAAMTAKVLKLANSAFYNPTRQPVSTISRAIVVLGFNAVADMALGIALVDALLASGVRRRVVDEMARSFHAAVQARALAVSIGERRAEEIFIAALLSRIGEMAFWCFGEDLATRLDRELDQPGVDADQAQQSVLGFRLRQLTAGLAREWHLGALVQAVVERSPSAGRAGELVRCCHRLSAAVEDGWHSPAARKAVAGLADLSGRPERELLDDLKSQAEEAARVATSFGAAEAARLIPLGEHGSLDEEEPGSEPAHPTADPQLQLQILRELSAMIASRAPLNDVLHLAMEGLYRTLGLERALFALLASNRTQLVGKAALGRGAEHLAQRFVFTVAAGPDSDPIRTAIQQALPVRLSAADSLGGGADRLRRVVGEGAFCLVPICAAGRPVGLFYADKRAGSIDEDAYQALLHFAQQASMAVTQVAAAPNRAR